LLKITSDEIKTTIVNTWNNNLPIGQCENGQEFDPDSAMALTKLFERAFKFSNGEKIISSLIRQ
jgi:hypothetical protein